MTATNRLNTGGKCVFQGKMIYECGDLDCDGERFVELGGKVCCKECGGVAVEISEDKLTESTTESEVKVMSRQWTEKYLQGARSDED